MPGSIQTNRALIIGINKYQKLPAHLQELRGARADATELHERLTEFSGDFVIAKEHFLIDENATRERIWRGISDLIWQSQQCELVLLYFAGHGEIDGNNHGFLAPYDMDWENPLVNGISMEMLRQLLLESGNTNVLAVIDCCYSGIVAEISGRGGGAQLTAKEVVDKAAAPWEQVAQSEKGKYILAASGAEQTAREIERPHPPADAVHVHGALTYHLLEALNGQATEEHAGSSGYVYLEPVLRYVGESMRAAAVAGDLKQTPQLTVSTALTAKGIGLVRPRDYADIIQNRLGQIRTYLLSNEAAGIIIAAQELHEISGWPHVSRNSDVADLLSSIERQLEDMQKRVAIWLDRNQIELRRATATKIGVFDELRRLCDDLTMNGIARMNRRTQGLLSDLTRSAIAEYASEDDETRAVVKFAEICNRPSGVFDNPPAAAARILNTRIPS